MMPFLIPIVAILAGAYAKVAKIKAEAARDLGRATSHLEDALSDARADRERLRRRLEALEAIVTSEGFDLEREARRAGLVPSPLDAPPLADSVRPAQTASTAPETSAARIDPSLLDAPDAFALNTSVPADADRQRARG